MTSTLAEVLEQHSRVLAARCTPAQLASEAQTVLGQKLAAYALAEPHPRTIGRYARGELTPTASHLRRLADVYAVLNVAQASMPQSMVAPWMVGKNRKLDGEAPIEYLHRDQAHITMRAARTRLDPSDPWTLTR